MTTPRTVDPVYVPLQVLCPKGTTAAAPLSTAVSGVRGMLESVDLQIPPGHAGATGIRFLLSGQQFLPWSNTVAWIIGDTLFERFDVGTYVDNKLTVVTFNVGNYDHTFFLRFKVRQVEATSRPPTLTLVPNETIAPTVAATTDVDGAQGTAG